MQHLEWTPTMDSEAFIDNIKKMRHAAEIVPLRDGTKCQAMKCTVGKFFLDSFVGLDDTVAENVLRELRGFQAPIFTMKIEPTAANRGSKRPATRGARRRSGRLQRLCDALGRMTTRIEIPLRRFYPGLEDGIASCIGGVMKNVHIEDNGGNEALPACQELLSALEVSTSVRRISLDIPTRFYRDMAPVLTRVPVCCFGSFRLLTEQVVVPEDASAIADLMTDSPYLQAVELAWLDFSSAESYRLLRCGMIQGRSKSLEIQRCTLGDAIETATALAGNEALQEVTLSQLSFTHHSLPQFIDALKARATEMHNLKGLHLLFEDVDDPVLHSTMATFVRDAALFPILSDVQLGCFLYSDRLDDALAHCVRYNTKIRSLSVYCPRTSNPCYKLPALCAALTGNHKVAIILGYPWSYNANLRNIIGRSERKGHWHGDDYSHLSMVSDLNRNGREYLSRDATNRSLGIDLLSKVNGTMDPIFYHLRENLLCSGRPSEPKVTVARKRKTLAPPVESHRRKSSRLDTK